MNNDQVFHCPNCGAILNNQKGFSSELDAWICTNCGQFMQSEVVAVKETTHFSSHQDEKNSVQNSKRNLKESESQKRKKHPIRNFFLFLLILLCGGGYYLYRYELSDLKYATSLADTYIGKDYFEALISLRDKGYTNIELIPKQVTRYSKTEEGIIDNVTFNKPVNLINSAIGFFSANSESTPVFLKPDSKIQLEYFPFNQKNLEEFNDKKNITLEFNSIVLSLPNYYAVKTENSQKLSCKIKNDEATSLTIQISDSQQLPDDNFLKDQYLIKEDTYVLEDINHNKFQGRLCELLAKQNGQVFRIKTFCFTPLSQENYIHITLISPYNCKYDYSNDYDKILKNTIVLGKDDIRIDFSSNDLKGKNIDDVIAQLKQAGFKAFTRQKTPPKTFLDKIDTVTNVVINGDTSLEKGNIYSTNSTITVTFFSDN